MKPAVRWLMVPLVVVALLGGLLPANALDKQTRLNVMSAVVQISLVKIQGGQTYYLPWGSGTIISSDGLILTNCHVADPIRFGLGADQVPDYDALGVGLTVKSDRPPQLSYLAEVLQADPDLDLAVIRITKTTDQSPVDPVDLNLPFVEVGDSDQIEVGDDLNVFGYPGIGGDTVTFTRGVVSGFTLDAGIVGRAWVKTDASISGGNSGGTGVDEAGLLIGVPTRAGVGGDTDPVDCRPVKDTNGDGRIDDNDDCVPIGGFINALRPVNLAKPLIEAARLGLPDTGRQRSSESGDQPVGNAQLSNLFFSSGVNELNQPTQLVSSLPSGARSLYLFFDYSGMDQSRMFEMKVTVDGVEQPDWALPASAWSGDEHGMWWIGWSDATFADGTYDLALLVDGQPLANAQIRIGGRPQAGPAISNLVLSLESTSAGGPKDPGVLFPSGATQVMAFFDFSGMTNTTNWTRSWLLDGEEIARKDETWRFGSSGSTSLTLTNQSGFESGAYRVSLYINGKLAALSNFWVTGAEGASFDPVRFATGVDKKGNPVGLADRFASGLEELHAFSDYTGMEDGVDVVVNWYVDDEKVVEWPLTWDSGESGTWHDYLYSDSGSLPDGTYAVELVVQGETLQQGSAVVGTGAAPAPVPDVGGDGVQIMGTIVDLDTDRAIPGAVFIVLKPGITLDAFNWTDDEVFTLAEADQQGYFSLPDLVERGQCYSVVIGADQYWMYGEDDVCFDQDTESPLILDVKLEAK
jgi:S1-C subfamily serine protease